MHGQHCPRTCFEPGPPPHRSQLGSRLATSLAVHTPCGAGDRSQEKGRLPDRLDVHSVLPGELSGIYPRQLQKIQSHDIGVLKIQILH